MDKLLEMLKKLRPDVDFEKEKALIDDGLLGWSFDIIVLVSSIENEFGVKISPEDLTPDNFNSIEEIYKLIESKK